MVFFILKFEIHNDIIQMITIDRIIPPKKLECKECFGPAEAEYKPTVEPEKVGIRSVFLSKPLLRCVDPECGEVFVAPRQESYCMTPFVRPLGCSCPMKSNRLEKSTWHLRA